MSSRRSLLAAGAAIAAASLAAFGGTATAAFPNTSDCPRDSVDVCIDARGNAGGKLTIKKTTIPLGAGKLQIRGGIDLLSAEVPTFRPAIGTSGLIGAPVPVPGGLLGIPLPVFWNTVWATVELAGDPSSLRINPFDLTTSLPVKVRLANRLIGANCHIGSDADPIQLTLVTGTTSPPPPNGPITGSPGTPTVDEATGTFLLSGAAIVDNSFAVPGASGCGHFSRGTLVNRLIDRRLGLPSAAGRNGVVLPLDLAIQLANPEQQ
jgi:hypothetical protein